ANGLPSMLYSTRPRSISASARTSSGRTWRRSGRGCTVMPPHPFSIQVCAARQMSGSWPPRELRSTAILLRLTLSKVMAVVRHEGRSATLPRSRGVGKRVAADAPRGAAPGQRGERIDADVEPMQLPRGGVLAVQPLQHQPVRLATERQPVQPECEAAAQRLQHRFARGPQFEEARAPFGLVQRAQPAGFLGREEALRDLQRVRARAALFQVDARRDAARAGRVRPPPVAPRPARRPGSPRAGPAGVRAPHPSAAATARHESRQRAGALLLSRAGIRRWRACAHADGQAPPRTSRRRATSISGEARLIAGWLLLLVALLYVGLLYGVAWAGDRRPLYPRQPRLRPIVYSLALAVYCSSWTFYGAVGTAAREGLGYLPIYLGPVLLFVFGFGLLRRLVEVAQQRNI